MGRTRRRRRLGAVLAVAAMTSALAVGAAATAGPAAAAPLCFLDPGAPTFDGTQHVDTANGIPAETVAGQADAGVVDVRYLCDSTRAPQELHLPTVHAGDRFGASFTALYLNHDDYTDLIVGVPGYDVGAAKDAGAVAVFYGSANGLVFHSIWTQDTAGVPGTPQAGAQFGAAVSSGVHGEDTLATDRQVRIGEPYRDITTSSGVVKDAGAWVELHYNSTRETSTGTYEASMNTPGVPGVPGAGDHLGAALDRLYLVGAPGHAVAGHPGAGAVIYAGQDPAHGAKYFTQDTPGVPGTAEDGDHFGAAVSERWVGVPDEDVGTVVDAGAVESLPGLEGPSAFAADTSSFSGVALQAGAHFGAALYEGHGYIDQAGYDPGTVEVGAPGLNTSAGADVGTTYLINLVVDTELGTVTGIEPATVQGPPTAIAGGRYGSAFGSGNGTTVGAPGGSGRVYMYTYDPSTHADAVTTFTQPAGTAATGYGSAVLTISL